MRQRRTVDRVSEPLTITLESGRVVSGILWLHPSGRGKFEVEYHGHRKTDGRSYTDAAHLMAIARILLRELAEEHPN